MATGNYGNIRCADVAPQDVEIFYTYQATYAQLPSSPQLLNASQVLIPAQHPTETNMVLGGLYTLNLPQAKFNQKGIYTILLRPKGIKTQILDCGVLSASPDTRGLVFDLATISNEDRAKFENGVLIGARIEYLKIEANVAERKIQNLHTIVTSNFKVEPVTTNVSVPTQKAVVYRANDNANLVFATVTPSTAPYSRTNLVPFIGLPTQTVYIYPTYFDTYCLTLELTEHDLDTLGLGLFGEQSRSVDDGIRTIYDQDGNIYKQFLEQTVKTEFDGNTYDVKLEKNNIDFSKDLDNIVPNQNV